MNKHWWSDEQAHNLEPAKLIRHIKLLNIHSKACVLQQALEEFLWPIVDLASSSARFPLEINIYEEPLLKDPTEIGKIWVPA